MINSNSLMGSIFAILGIAWIIYSAIGIKRKKLSTYGRGGIRREHHGHKAVQEGIFQILLGLSFLLFGLFIMFSSVAHA